MQFSIDEFRVDVTGSKNIDQFGNKKLLNFGCKKQCYTVEKKGDELEVQVCGWTLGSHDKIEEIMKFMVRSQNMVKKMGKNLI